MLEIKFTDKLLSVVVNEFAAQFESFLLSPLEKYQQFSHMGPWSATHDPRELTFLKAYKENLRIMETAFVFAEYFQNLLYTCLWTGLTSLVYLEYI